MARRPTDRARIEVKINKFVAVRPFDAAVGKAMADAAQEVVSRAFSDSLSFSVVRSGGRDAVEVNGQITELALEHDGLMLGCRLKLEATGRGGRPVRTEQAYGEEFGGRASPSPAELMRFAVRFIEQMAALEGQRLSIQAWRSFMR